MAPATYCYRPLSSEASFRLIRLQMPQPSRTCLLDTVQIQLYEENMDIASQYEAISYTWGQEKANSVISCNGKPLQVTPTVEAILRTLQLKDPNKVLWIDQISIDQSCVPERNMQVSKMRQIYHQAKNVWIWLGEESDETMAGFMFLSEIAKLFGRYGEYSDADLLQSEELKKLHKDFTGKQIRSS